MKTGLFLNFFPIIVKIYGGCLAAECGEGPGDLSPEGSTCQALPEFSCAAEDQERPSGQHQGGGRVASEMYPKENDHNSEYRKALTSF